MLAFTNGGESIGRNWGAFMRVKAIAFLVIVAASAILFAVMRTENRADAAGGNCYSADQGPTTPTICS